MSLVDMAAKIFMSQMGSKGGNMDLGNVVGALKGLLPTSGGDLDLGAIVGQFMGQGGGLASLAQSWLGNGANDSISASQIMGMLGESKVSDFANNLGIDKDTAASGLSDMIPQLIDKSSEGGNLLGGGDAGAIAKNLLGKFF